MSICGHILCIIIYVIYIYIYIHEKFFPGSISSQGKIDSKLFQLVLDFKLSARHPVHPSRVEIIISVIVIINW